MSLNGLDDVKVKEAYEAAAAEPGGWFLLKYSSRDEVELLGRGNGGIVEVRNTIAQHEDPTPLFGFLRYRRRNVVIKYVPEECSRLVQARVSVHFSAVTERFSPHDTIFAITSPKELRDTKLSAACSLHTASGSTSSSTSSLRRRRLMEIAEDAEEDNRAKRQSTVPEERPPTAKASSVSGIQTSITESSQPVLPSDVPPSTNYRSIIADLETSPPPPREPTSPLSPTKSVDESRNSFQSARPDFFSSTSYGSNGKPKVKLGPRPSLDVGGRSHTTATVSQFRPVSTLPMGLKVFSKGSQKIKDRPQSQHPTDAPSMTLSPPPLPSSPPPQSLSLASSRPHTSGGRPTTSSGASIHSSISPAMSTSKQPIMTPEKARLMKALELRKKQKNAAVTPGPLSPSTLTASNTLASPISESNRTSAGAPKEVHDTLAMLNDMAKEDDSGIAFDASSTLKTDDSDATRSDSYPVSPIGPSERAESTRASSISESTDETVQETNTSKRSPSHAREASIEEIAVGHSETELLDDDLTAEAKYEKHEILEPPIEDLLTLLPVTYKPASSSEDVAGTRHAGDVSEGRREQIISDSAEIVSRPEKVEPSPLLSDDVVDTTKMPSSNTEFTTEVIENHPEVFQMPQILEQPPSPVKEWKVPRSKFNATANSPETPDEPLPSNNMVDFAPTQKSPAASSFSVDRRASVTDDDQENSQVSQRKKRRGLVEPIRTDIDLTDASAANSDANFSSDDDLMDELQSAVVQEAMPISVSKSPMSPVFPSPKKQNGERNRFSRAFSNPLRKDKSDAPLLNLPDSPQPESSRSVSASAAYLNRINHQPSMPMAKKVNLGSGISQRIKALEKLSNNAPGATVTSGTIGPPPGSSPAFFSVRKGSVRASSRSPSIAERANSLTRQSPSPDSSPDTSRIRNRSGSIQSRVDAFKANPVPTTLPQRPYPETISVTARIVREPTHPFPAKSEAGKDPLDYTSLNLKQSPLVIDHRRAAVELPKETIQEMRRSKDKERSVSPSKRERRSSITVIKDLISEKRTSFSERRRSINLESASSLVRLKSPSRSRPPSTHASPAHQRTMSISSRLSIGSREQDTTISPPPTAGSSSSTSDEKSEKKSNRASRMLRRMSSSLSSSRKTLTHAVSPTVREESEPAHGIDAQSLTSSGLSLASVTPTSINIGDVNVQFPDTLLWKRRSMLLDSQGFIILSPALTATGNVKDKAISGATRRFHLSEFRVPAIPDVEMQELPNSVVLDFIEGGGLQVACEDRAGQAGVLKVLQDAHRTWAAYGQ